jgi:hypothetical protein
VSYTDDERRTLQEAHDDVRSAWRELQTASTVLRRVHPRHPLFYRANVILRELEGLQDEIRREAAK